MKHDPSSLNIKYLRLNQSSTMENCKVAIIQLFPKVSASLSIYLADISILTRLGLNSQTRQKTITDEPQSSSKRPRLVVHIWQFSQNTISPTSTPATTQKSDSDAPTGRNISTHIVISQRNATSVLYLVHLENCTTTTHLSTQHTSLTTKETYEANTRRKIFGIQKDRL